MKVYLAGPINGCTDEQAQHWRARARAWLEQHGIQVLDPMRRDYRGVELEQYNPGAIVSGDLSDIASADAMLVNCERPSWGTSMEVRVAFSEMGKIVVGFLSEPWKASPWLVQHTHLIATTPELAVAELARVLTSSSSRQ